MSPQAHAWGWTQPSESRTAGMSWDTSEQNAPLLVERQLLTPMQQVAPPASNTQHAARSSRSSLTNQICFAFPFDFRKGTRNWPATPISGLLNQKPVWSSQVGAAQPQCPPPLALPHPSLCPHLKHAVLTQAGARAEPHTTPLGTSLRAPTMIYKQYRQTKKQRWW